jgi:outer membrane protein TolC
MGRPLDTEIELTDTLSMVPVDAVDVPKATAKAMSSRADWKAQHEKERSAALTVSATRMDRLPSLDAFANYGSTGTGVDSASPTRTYGIAMKLPVFDSGRRKAKVMESVSQLRQEQAHTRDLHDQIELDVRVALDSLQAAEKEVIAAQEGLALAEKELSQARKRYEVGVANSLEVTDAQTRLARARDNRVVALYQHNLARIALGEATGAILNIAN